MFKLVVAGSRDFNDYELLKHKLIYYLQLHDLADVEIVSGGARGADKLGERFAHEHGCKLTIMNADWDTYGKSAGYRRNAEMARYSDGCIVFWDGISKGTQHMINLAKQAEIKTIVVNYKENQ